MNLNKKLISISLVAVLIASLAFSVMFSETMEYEAMTDGSDIIKNASFTDIKNDTNAENIMKMAVYSVIREYGSTTYNPKGNAARQDILAALVRAIGKQEQAIQKGDAIKAQNPTMSTTEAYLRGHIEIAKADGIITAEEIAAASELTKAELQAIEEEVNKIVKANWKITVAEKNKLLQDKKDQKSYDKTFKTAAAREEAAMWIARALGLKPVTGEQTMSVYSFTDWKSLKTADLPYIEAVLRANYIQGATPTKFTPKGSISRSEMASIMNEIVTQNLGKLGYSTGYGEVTKVKNIKEATVYGQKDVTEISIQTPAGDTVNITVNNKTQALPVIKSSKVGSQTLIAEGDVVEYTINNNNRALLLHVGKFKEMLGTFNGYNQQLGVAYLKDQNNKQYTMQVMPDTIVSAEGIPVDIKKVEPGTPMSAIYSGNTLKSLDLKVSPDTINTEEMLVKILFADSLGNVMKVTDENGNKHYLYMDDNMSVYINDEISSRDAIGFDQDALLTVADDKVMEARIFTDIPVEEAERDMVFTARVREVVGDNIILTRDDKPDSQETYILDGNSTIVKDKQIVNKSRIKSGDRIKAYVNTGKDNYITKLEVQGEGVLMKNLYKGDIKEVSTYSGQLVLTNVYTYGYYDWEKVADYMTLDTADAVKIFRNSSTLKLDDLKQYLGKTIYAASKENYGDEELVHVVVKEGYEDALYKKIDDIKWTANQMTLSDGRLINFLEGSIIIKDGRLLDTLDLTENSGAFIIQNKSFTGIGTAPIIGLDSFNGFSGYKISKGYLHNMGEDYYTVENGYRLTNNNWDKWNEFTFYLSNDTYVWDSIVTNGVITAKKLAESRFKPYTYTWPNYNESKTGNEYHEDNQYHSNYTLKNTTYYHEHSLVYTITDAYGNTQAINLFKKDKESFNPLPTHNERMIAGKISTIDIDNQLMTLKQVMDYSPVYESWQPINAEVPIDLARAIILKDDKVIDAEDIGNDDSIYVLANDGYAIFIIVQ